MRLHIEADGEIDRFPKKPKSYVLAVVKAIEGNTILLKQPLKFAAPAKALIRHEDAPNLIEVRGWGLLLGVELDVDRIGRDAKSVAADLLVAGLVTNPVTSSALRLAPPLIIDETHVDDACTRIEKAIR